MGTVLTALRASKVPLSFVPPQSVHVALKTSTSKLVLLKFWLEFWRLCGGGALVSSLAAFGLRLLLVLRSGWARRMS